MNGASALNESIQLEAVAASLFLAASVGRSGPFTHLWIAAVVVEGVRGIVRAFEARDCAQVLVDGLHVMVGHVVECGPWHDLEKSSIDGRRNAVCRSGNRSRRRAGWVKLVEVHAGLEDFFEFGEGVAALGPASFIWREIASDDVGAD